ncbi:twin-arginine translocase TatA/TatE family subunit [Stappia sp. GBMRC 2046]|uniref:Sec-independent protein translocase protein TatA n=1 Tax=Stappia sediminis TaxID=2692190 RepID=A0A7X3LT06_9HYPH|nr:twin-arginine translocase TatA/TatE family subunit [Stappia sediminis]MXN64565.1 twin-arginine translocase TatA/TatE family subunit [Stappia sediminis]
MGISFWQILIIAVIIVLLFGRGKISELMGDVAKGIKSFKKGLNEDEAAEAEKDDPKTIDHNPTESASAQQSEDKSKAS